MSKRSQGLQINVSPHAMDRYREYVYRKAKTAQVAGKVGRHLWEQLKTEKGLQVDHTGAGHVEIVKDTIWAVVVPAVEGGWDVVTFHRGEHRKPE